MKLETWAGPNGTRREQNLELQLKIQDAAELAQQNKEQSGLRRCLTKKHSRATMHVHPLVAESGILLGELIAGEDAEAVDVTTCRALIHHAHEAVERGPLLLALVRSVGLPAVTAVDDLNDGLDDLAAGTSGWGG